MLWELLVVVAALLAAGSFQVNCQTVNLTLTPEEQTVNEGQSAEFTCSPLITIGSSVLNTIAPGSTEAEGLNNDDRVTSRDNTTVDPNVRIFIWLSAVREDNGRQFFCALSGSMSNISTLYVNYGVTITIEEDRDTPMVGESLAVNISVEGRPTPSVQWSLNGSTIGNTATRTVNSTGLVISTVVIEDAGEYEVTGTNDVNSASVSFMVILDREPVFNAGIGTVVLPLSVGQRGVINCSSISVTNVTSTTLTRGSTSIPLEPDITFTIPSASSQDVGMYTCTATNQRGTAMLIVDVQVGSVPGTVSNIRLDKNDGNKLTILWDAADIMGVRITGYEIVIEYAEKTIMATVSPPSLSYDVTRDKLGIPKEGKDIMIKITITAVNEIGRGDPVSLDTTATFGSVSSSLSTLPCAIILVTCTALSML